MSRCFVSNIVGAGMCLATLALVQVPVATTAAAADAIAVGTVPGDVTSMGPWFAKAAGLFEKYGLDAELVTIQGGSRGVQVLLSNNIQAMQVGFSVAVRANQQGADLRMITSTSNAMPMDFYVVPSIKTADDLKGKTIAISSFTAESDMAVSLALKKLGLPRSDVVVTQLGGSSNRIAGMEAGNAVAAPFVAPANKKAEAKGFVKMVDLGRDGAPYLFNGLVVNNAMLTEKRDILKRFVKANIEAEHRALSDGDWARKVIGEQFKTDKADIIDEAYRVFKQVTPVDGRPSDEAITTVIGLVKDLGTELTKSSPSDFVDLSILDELQKEGFFDELKKKYGV